MNTLPSMACVFCITASARRHALLALAAAVLFAAGPTFAQSPPHCEPQQELQRLTNELLDSVSTATEMEFRAALAARKLPLLGIRVLFLPSPDQARADAFLNNTQDEAASGLYCATASSERGTLLLAAPELGHLEPIDPRSPTIRGSLATSLTRPSVVIAMPDYRFVRLGLTEAQLEQGVPLTIELVTPARVQLLAESESGPRPLTQIEVGETESNIPLSASLPTPGQGASGVVGWLRQLAQRPAVRRNRLLRDAANRHACHVCKRGEVTHVIAGDDPPARLLAQGLSARRVGEVVARGKDAQAALAALVDSPSHLMTLLERDFTDVGVGLAQDGRGHACVVVLLATFPRFVGRLSTTVSEGRSQ